MTLLEFTPQRERARHAALVERARRATPARPFVLLCPREALATALETRVARAGGAAVRVLGWDALCDLLEDALDIPPVPLAAETTRAALVEAALERSAEGEPGLARALAVDAYGVALAALSVLDELRSAGWSGEPAVVDAAVPPDASGATALVRGHLALVGEWIRALENGLRAAGLADLPLRLARIAASGAEPRELPEELFVDGVDRLTPLERAALEKLGSGGTRVDVAPWVHGWRGRSARPLEPPSAPRTALEAYGRGLGHTAPGDDDSVVELTARDPDDEADAAARWLAALPEGERARAAVMVPREVGYAPRLLRALERHGLSGAYACSEPVRCAPLWQVVRASIRLAWLGADAVELATVLSAPGAGIWGADRDRLCARLRERVPTAWSAVREELDAATDPVRAWAPDALRAVETVANPPTPPASPDPERVRQLLEARERVGELIALWESAGPIARRPAGERLESLRTAVAATLARFANPMRFRESFDGARDSARWVAAANAIRAAFDAVLARFARGGPVLPAHDPSTVLAPVEALLGDAPDAQNRRREDAVRVLVETPFLAERPDVLLVLGFQRGRYPSPAPRLLLLGPLELEALRRAAAVVPGLSDLPDDGARAALAERDARRALCLPAARLVLCAPRRDAAGESLEPALARRDLLAAYPPDVAAARARTGASTARAFARAASHEPPTVRARLEDAAERLGAGDPGSALDVLGAPGPLPPGARELLAARFRPDRGFQLGPLLRERLRAAEFSANALENLLKCRYSFLASALLRLRDLPLARAPSLSPRDHAVLALETLSQLDRAGNAAPDPAAVDAAVAAAVAARLPWAEGEIGGVSLHELRRTVRGFVERYLHTRAAWGLEAGPEPPASEPGAAEDRAVRLPLATQSEHAPREIAVVGEPARVERVGGANGEAVLVELRLGRVDALEEQREAGLGVASALMPAVVERRLGVPVAAVATVSLGRPDAAVLAGAGRGNRFASASGGAEVVARAEDLAAHREGVLARIAAAVDDVAGDAGDFRPHTHEERARLERVGATSCERCAARLACRFDAGEGGA